MDYTKLTKEDEELIIEQGLKSPFWLLLSAKWGGFMDGAMMSLLSPDYRHRDFLAGKIRGMRDLLSWPERRLSNLESKEEKESKSR